MADPRMERINASAAATLASLRENAARSSRDPRAASRAIVHKNVSIVETCRFYGVADAISSCRVPRSCSDCLAMPECRLTEYGCIPAEDKKPWYDYHWLLGNQPNGTAYNQSTLEPTRVTLTFFATNTTLCAQSDAVCSQCRATFRQLATSRKTVSSLQDQFCVGEGGCVCIAMCEVPEVYALLAADEGCGAKFLALPRAANVPNSTSVRRDPRAAPTQIQTRTVDDSCEYYSQTDLRGCRVPRSCSDCLRKKGCMIDDYKCVGMSNYNSALDFRNATRPNNAYTSSSLTDRILIRPQYQFPSTNTTYCLPTDSACYSCDHAYDNLIQGGTRINTYCVGAGGCVCIAQCVASGEERVGLQDKCGFTSGQSNGLAAAVIGGTFLALLLGFFVWKLLQSRLPGDHGRAAQLLRNMLEQAPTLTLDLYGWRQFQRSLIEKEQELLAGAENVSPVSRPVDFEFVEPTAPDFDDDESSAPSSSDPRALASAPVYRSMGATHASPRIGWGMLATDGDSDDPDPDATIPTAPDYQTDL